MTDQSQNVVNSYAYEPFGKLTNESETIPQPFKYVGQYGVMAEENALIYMRARHYDSDTGRFISEDPIGFGGGQVNLYSYVNNNPINFMDPFGLKAYKISFGARASLGFGGSLEIGFVWDDQGNRGLLLSGGVGSGVEIGIAETLKGVANATKAILGGSVSGIEGTIDNFNGSSLEAKISAGPIPISGSFDLNSNAQFNGVDVGSVGGGVYKIQTKVFSVGGSRK